MNNKILIELYVVKMGTCYELFVPCNKKIKNVLLLISKAINDMTEGEFLVNNRTTLIDKTTGQFYNPEGTLKEQGCLNGCQLIMI